MIKYADPYLACEGNYATVIIRGDSLVFDLRRVVWARALRHNLPDRLMLAIF